MGDSKIKPGSLLQERDCLTHTLDPVEIPGSLNETNSNKLRNFGTLKKDGPRRRVEGGVEEEEMGPGASKRDVPKDAGVAEKEVRGKIRKEGRGEEKIMQRAEVLPIQEVEVAWTDALTVHEERFSRSVVLAWEGVSVAKWDVIVRVIMGRWEDISPLKIWTLGSRKAVLRLPSTSMKDKALFFSLSGGMGWEVLNWEEGEVSLEGIAVAVEGCQGG
ncbi:hypothetical protein QJS10_CPA03g01570 [Acorus calamus]|uniref:Uncharacterized protein n=1 Tax=Acorus calamus TaxID=4465 RepID=A0AAV9FAU3_ACOCL|nr:hypothetical protein QJS10_CPA03g01570 [Acorus calamus]